MTDVLMEIVKDKIDERVNAAISTAVAAKEQETKVVDIKNIMCNLQLTLDQAMDALNIPQGQRSVYADLIKNLKVVQ